MISFSLRDKMPSYWDFESHLNFFNRNKILNSTMYKINRQKYYRLTHFVVVGLSREKFVVNKI